MRAPLSAASAAVAARAPTRQIRLAVRGRAGEVLHAQTNFVELRRAVELVGRDGQVWELACAAERTMVWRPQEVVPGQCGAEELVAPNFSAMRCQARDRCHRTRPLQFRG